MIEFPWVSRDFCFMKSVKKKRLANQFSGGYTNKNALISTFICNFRYDEYHAKLHNLQIMMVHEISNKKKLSNARL